MGDHSEEEARRCKGMEEASSSSRQGGVEDREGRRR